MRSKGNDLFRVTMMRPARNMPEVASASVVIRKSEGEQKRSRSGMQGSSRRASGRISMEII
jgi:hypothetical protein